MELEVYFEFLDPDDIHIKGHRIGIDHVIQYQCGSIILVNSALELAKTQ